jgi:lysine 6-dehydrogenase
VPYQFAPVIAQAAIAGRCHLVDLGGSPPATQAILALDQAAQAAGIALVPDMGLCPGITNLMAAVAARALDPGCTVRIRVGGLPQHPEPPLNYRCVFSARGLLNEYLADADVVRGGEPRKAPAMTELEEDDYPTLGRLEAFLTTGGVSTLAGSLAGHADSLDVKTLRYPGHCAQIRLLLDLGLSSDQPVRTAGGVEVAPRDVLEAVLEREIPDDGKDLVIGRVEAQGTKDGGPHRIRYDFLDYADPATGLSAMQRTTAFPATSLAHALASGDVPFAGAQPSENWFPLDVMLTDLAARGVSVDRSESA